MQIKGKRVVVTGAASGIGKALCETFKEAGVNEIISVDLNKDVEETSNIVGGISIIADVSKESDILNIIDTSQDYCGGIDIFCSNAGIMGTPGFFEAEIDDWQNIWEVNVLSHILAAKHVLPQMLDRGEGYLMNTASAAGLLTQIGAAGYSVTKASAVSFAQWIKITYGSKGIGVSCLCPQAVRTAMTGGGPGVAGVDGMMEPKEVALCVMDSIENERFLVTPHKEVLEYIKRKGADPDRWIKGMQRLQERFEDWTPDN
tara:strand:+ start:4074 stop:4850 length:777 start_codon:yes stop_codon:yes gene_type:complete